MNVRTLSVIHFSSSHKFNKSMAEETDKSKADDRDAAAIATDLYMYLVPRRMGIPHTPAELPNPREKSRFTEEVGKAILIVCHYYQRRLSEKFARDYRIFANDRDAFMRYCVETGFTLFDERSDDVFESLFLVSAMILELVTFCYVQSFEIHFWYADFCWAEIFKFHLKDKFFKNGGWVKCRELARRSAEVFDANGFGLHEAPGQARKNHLWLTQYDCKMDNVSPIITKTSTLIDFGAAKSELSRNSLNSEGIPEGDRKVRRDLSTQIESKNFLAANDDLQSASSVQVVGSMIADLLNLHASPANTKSARVLGFIPKLSIPKHVKRNPEKTYSDNTELLETFINIICDDDFGENLCQILRNRENAERLVIDRRFLRMVTMTVENSEKRPCTREILEYVLKKIDTIKFQPVSDFLPRSDSKLPEKLTIQGFDTFEGEYKRKEMLNEAISLPLPESSGVNEGAKLSLNIQDEPEKCFKIGETINIPFLREQSSALMGLFGKVTIESEQHTSGLGKRAKQFNEEFGSKFDYKYMKEQFEMDYTSTDMSLRKAQRDIVIEEILLPLDGLDSCIKKTDKTRKIEKELEGKRIAENKKMRKKRRKLARSMIRDLLVKNFYKTNDLFCMTTLFRTKEGSSELQKIHNLLEENFRKNQDAFKALKLFPSDATATSRLGKISALDFAENISRVSKEIERQTSKDEADMDKCVDSTQEEDDSDDRKMKQMRGAIEGLLIIYQMNREHLNSLHSTLKTSNSAEASQTTTQHADTTAKNSNLPANQIMETIQKGFEDLSLGPSEKMTVLHSPTESPPRRSADDYGVSPDGSTESILPPDVTPIKGSNKSDASVSPNTPYPASPVETTLSSSSTVEDSPRNSLQQPAASSKSLDDQKREGNISLLECEKGKTIWHVDLVPDESSSGEDACLGAAEKGCFRDSADHQSTDTRNHQQSRLSPIDEGEEKIIVIQMKRTRKRKGKK